MNKQAAETKYAQKGKNKRAAYKEIKNAYKAQGR